MKFLLVVFGLLSMSYSICQPLFNKTYQAPWINLSSNIEIFGNNYYVLGQRLDDINKKITLMKLDQNGDTLQTSFYGEADRAFFAQKLILRNNDILVFGGVNFDDFGINSDLFLASFDYNFDVNWVKYYGGSNFDSGLDLHENTDGTLMLCGSKSSTSANIEDFYLVKTDANGNVIWEKTYGGNNKDVANSIIKSYNGGYLISGVSNSFSADDDILIYTIDDNGNELWHNNYGSTLGEFDGNIVLLKDKSYLFYKTERTLTSYNAITMRIDLNGKVIQTKSYNETSASTLSLSKPLSLDDGSMVIVGHVRSILDNPVGRILKLDPLGNILWNRKYLVREDRSQYIYDIQTTSDGGFVFCGSAFDSTNTQRNWVAKLDCFGCDGVLCDSTGVACKLYDCSTKDFEADIQASALSVELYNANHTLNFSDNASQSSNREWILPDTILYTTGTVSYTFDVPGTYPITLINYHGVCSDTSVVMVEVGYGLGPLPMVGDKGAGFKINPNPNSGLFTIELNKSLSIQELKLLDELGRTIKILDPKSKSFELNLSKGVYFLELKSEQLSILEKFVVF